jgi:hypothetical protein
MSHIIHSSDTVKDCAPTIVHALLALLGALCRLHSMSNVADAARNWARLCEALVSVHLKATVKQVLSFSCTSLNLFHVSSLFYTSVCLCGRRNMAPSTSISDGPCGSAAAP